MNPKMKTKAELDSQIEALEQLVKELERRIMKAAEENKRDLLDTLWKGHMASMGLLRALIWVSGNEKDEPLTMATQLLSAMAKVKNMEKNINEATGGKISLHMPEWKNPPDFKKAFESGKRLNWSELGGID